MSTTLSSNSANNNEKYYLVIVSEDIRQSDIKSVLESHGLDAPVQTFLALGTVGETGVPQLSDPQNYEQIKAVLVHSGGDPFTNGTLVGNQVADYVLHGAGKVLVTLYTNYSTDAPDNCYHLAGRFEELHPFTYTPDYNFYDDDSLNLGAVLMPYHPIMHNVKNLANRLLCPCDVRDNSTCIAKWNKMDFPLLAERQFDNGAIVVALNMVAASKASFSNFYDPETTDCAKLMVNALHYLSAKKIRLLELLKRQYQRCAFTDIVFEL